MSKAKHIKEPINNVFIEKNREKIREVIAIMKERHDLDFTLEEDGQLEVKKNQFALICDKPLSFKNLKSLEIHLNHRKLSYSYLDTLNYEVAVVIGLKRGDDNE